MRHAVGLRHLFVASSLSLSPPSLQLFFSVVVIFTLSPAWRQPPSWISSFSLAILRWPASLWYLLASAWLKRWIRSPCFLSSLLFIVLQHVINFDSHLSLASTPDAAWFLFDRYFTLYYLSISLFFNHHLTLRFAFLLSLTPCFNLFLIHCALLLISLVFISALLFISIFMSVFTLAFSLKSSFPVFKLLSCELFLPFYFLSDPLLSLFYTLWTWKTVKKGNNKFVQQEYIYSTWQFYIK